MLYINANLIEQLKNKKSFENLSKATIIIEVIIIVINCLKDILFYRSKYV